MLNAVPLPVFADDTLNEIFAFTVCECDGKLSVVNVTVVDS